LTPTRFHDLTGAAALAADHLLALAADIPLAGIEQSCKFSEGALSPQRRLLGLPIERMGSTPLQNAHAVLGLPSSALPGFQLDRQRANFFYMGFDGAGQGLSYRFYLEFPVHLASHQGSATGGNPPALLARGYKWDALNAAASTCDVTEYWWYPRLTLGQILSRVAPLQSPQDPAGAAAKALLDAAIDLARTRSSALEWVYLEATEAGGQRQSFDLNLYTAGITLAELSEPITALGQVLHIPNGDVTAFMRGAAGNTLGHVSGGLGRDGQAFLTLYHTP